MGSVRDRGLAGVRVHFPSQAEVMAGLASPDWQCFGPFAAYEPSVPN